MTFYFVCAVLHNLLSTFFIRLPATFDYANYYKNDKVFIALIDGTQVLTEQKCNFFSSFLFMLHFFLSEPVNFELSWLFLYFCQFLATVFLSLFLNFK